MRIQLSEEIERYLGQLIEEGKFADESAAIEAALRQMRNRADKRDALRKAILADETVEPLAFRG